MTGAAVDGLRRWLAAAAAEAGFASLHVTDATLPESVAARLDEFLAAGHQGDMSWQDGAAPRLAAGHVAAGLKRHHPNDELRPGP